MKRRKEARVFPHGLSVREKEAADKELLALRMGRWNARSKKEQLQGFLLQLKYLTEAYKER